MSETPWRDLRIGDAEREVALRALGEHMSAGRLSVDEYGQRSAMVATGKTRGDLAELFADLPEPKPTFTRETPPPPAHSPPVYQPHYYPPPAHRPPRTLAQRLPQILLPVLGVALVLLVVFGFRFFPPFLLLPMIFLIAYSRRSRRWH